MPAQSDKKSGAQWVHRKIDKGTPLAKLLFLPNYKIKFGKGGKNPQNLYLFTEYGFSMKQFTLLMLPYSVASLVLLCVMVFWLNRTDHTVDHAETTAPVRPDLLQMFLYIALFMVCLATVVGSLHYLIMLGIVAAVILVMDHGAIIEEGKYEDLIAKGGYFAELVERQRLDA